VRLPREFQLDRTEVFITGEGGSLILTPPRTTCVEAYPGRPAAL